MARYLKFAAITAGGLLLALLAVGALVSASVDPNAYKSEIIRLVQQKHQRTLTIPGKITLALYPRVGAHLGAVTLSERGAPQEFAGAPV